MEKRCQNEIENYKLKFLAMLKEFNHLPGIYHNHQRRFSFN